MPILRTRNRGVLIHLRWPAAGDAPPLTNPALARLAPYVTRYAETLNTGVYAVGGAPDHLHVLLDLSPVHSLDAIVGELQSASARFLREQTALSGFAWDADESCLQSVSAGDKDELVAYIKNHADAAVMRPSFECEEEEASDGGGDEEMPDWLRSATKGFGL